MLLPARHPMYLALVESRGPAPKQALRIPTKLLKALSEPQMADIIRRRHVLMRLFARSDLQVPAQPVL